MMNSSAQFLSIYPFQFLLLPTIPKVYNTIKTRTKGLDYSGKFHSMANFTA